MASAGQSESRLERVAVVVTHGVGEAEPGECTATLVNVLGKEPGVEVEEAAEVLLLPDGVDPDPNDQARERASAEQPRPTFPVQLRHATVQNRLRLSFAELHWADLTRVGLGRVSSMLGLFRVIFEAHYIVDAMLDPRLGWTVRGLRFVLLWLSWLMRGPIAGMTVATAAVFWAALYVRPHGLFEGWPSQRLFGGVLVVVFLASLVLRIWSETRWDATWCTSLNWSLISSALFAVVLFTAPSPLTNILFHPLNFILGEWQKLAPASAAFLNIHPSITEFPRFAERADFVNVLYRNLIRLWITFGTVWVTCALPLLSLIGISAWSRTLRRPLFAPALAAFGILALQLALWTALVGTAVLPLLNRAQELIALTTLQKELEEQKVQIASITAANEEVKRLVDVADFPKDKYDWVARLVFAYGFNGVIVIVTILAGTCVFLVRWRLARRARGAEPDILASTAQGMPRVLFSWPVITTLVGLTLVQLVFNIMFAAETQKNAFAKEILNFMEKFAEKGTITEWKTAADGLFATYLNVTMLFAWMLALVFPLLMGRRFNNAVHIARDLIDHQYGPYRGRVLGHWRDRRLSDAERWPRRERIRRRMARLLTALAKRGGYDRIIFMAHSQGSVVLYDYLKGAADYVNANVSGAKPDIVIFGSPLSHLYQHYFREYEGLDPSLQRLSECTGRWINLYRIDDWIGVWVGQIGAACVENCPLGPGGHVDYWKEKALAQTILGLVERRPLSAAAE